jgi:hypothetical protein
MVRNPDGVPDAGKPRLLIQKYPVSQILEKPVAGLHWKASPATRMMKLLRASDMRLGLHERLKLPAYGGNLFDPDRFRFLEGRHEPKPGEKAKSWREEVANPLPVNNRTEDTIVLEKCGGLASAMVLSRCRAMLERLFPGGEVP